MANEYLKYYIEAIWKGKGATVEAKKDIEGVGTAGEKGTKGVNAFKGAVSTLAASAVLSVAAKQAYDFGAASVQAFSDSEEAYGKFSVVFGEFANKTEGDLETIADATGRSKFELIDFASTIQDTFVPLGFARGEAAKMATEVTELAIDLASFNNLETADVVRDLQSALVGNTETLRKYGVVAQETQIKQEALELGLWDGTGAMDAQTKANAILSLAYKGTTDAQGDAIRTADSLANKQRALEASTLDLKVAVGEGLVPALAAGASGMIPVINTVTDYINNNRLLKKALEDGIITQELYNKTAFSLGTGWEMESELLADVNKKIRENEQGMTDAEASMVRYYQGMGQLAAETEATKSESEQLNPAVLRLREAYMKAAEGSEEFSEKTGVSAAALRESAEAASAFNSAFVGALNDTESAYGKWVTTSTAVGGRTAAQEENFQDLTAEANRLRDSINSLQGGTAGLGLEEDALNQKLAEKYERLAQVEAALSPLAALTTEYTNAQSKWVVDAEALNSEMFKQVAGMSDNAIVTASAAIALGEYDEQQVSAALNAAIIQEKMKALAEAFVESEGKGINLREEMEKIVAGSPYESEIDVLTDQAIAAINKVKNKLDAIDGLVAKASVQVTTTTTGSATAGAASSGRVPGFATGGTVPGPVGSPQLILAHGGEQVLTREQQQGNSGVTQNFYANTREAQALAWAQAERLRRQRMDSF